MRKQRNLNTVIVMHWANTFSSFVTKHGENRAGIFILKTFISFINAEIKTLGEVWKKRTKRRQISLYFLISG
jgi:hypothetical protein